MSRTFRGALSSSPVLGSEWRKYIPKALMWDTCGSGRVKDTNGKEKEELGSGISPCPYSALGDVSKEGP